MWSPELCRLLTVQPVRSGRAPWPPQFLCYSLWRAAPPTNAALTPARRSCSSWCSRRGSSVMQSAWPSKWWRAQSGRVDLLPLVTWTYRTQHKNTEMKRQRWLIQQPVLCIIYCCGHFVLMEKLCFGRSQANGLSLLPTLVCVVLTSIWTPPCREDRELSYFPKRLIVLLKRRSWNSAAAASVIELCLQWNMFTESHQDLFSHSCKCVFQGGTPKVCWSPTSTSTKPLSIVSESQTNTPSLLQHPMMAPSKSGTVRRWRAKPQPRGGS